jgi:3-keto-5-aminohexanoate cleavage enzyme
MREVLLISLTRKRLIHFNEEVNMSTDKLIICAAISGGATTKVHNPNIPYTPEEFAEEARRCYEEGAAMVHIHGKDIHTGFGTVELEANRAAFEAIRAECPKLIVNISTGSTSDTAETRMKPIEVLKPEMCSFNTGTMNFALANHKTGEILIEFIYRNTFADMEHYAAVANAAGTKPEFEIFDPGGIGNLQILSRRGNLIRHPMHFQFVYGVAGGMQFDQALHLALVGMLPEGSTYSVCGVGAQQYKAAFMSIISGGHVRIGLEDNTRMPDKSPAKGSWEQILWVKELARVAGREVASPDEARAILGLAKGDE